jgi:hypothetical protein
MAIKKGVFVDESFFEPNHPRVSQILGFQKSIEMWQQVFGADALRVRLYPEGQKPSALIEDFFAATGLNQTGLNLASDEKRNANLSAGALQILNQMNEANKLVANQVSSKTFFDFLEKHAPGRGLSAKAETITKFDSFYAASNEWVRANFFANQETLFEKPLTAGADAQLDLTDVVGVLSAALEVIEERDREIAKFKGKFASIPKPVKRLLKRILSR